MEYAVIIHCQSEKIWENRIFDHQQKTQIAT